MATSYTTEPVTITKIERAKSSKTGNPRWTITYRYENGTVARPAVTAPNAAVGYEVGNPGIRVGNIVNLTYNGREHITNIVPLIDAFTAAGIRYTGPEHAS